MKIWHSEQDWPQDFGNFVFLARAVRVVGQALFPNEWTNLDPIKEFVEIPEPQQNSVKPKTRHLTDPSRLSPPPPGMAETLRRSREVAKATARRARASNAAYARASEVKAVLTRWFSQNSVRTYTRNHSGGNFSPMDGYSWNAENIDYRFSYCKIRDSDVYSEIFSYKDKSTSWIFVDSDNLIRELHKTYSMTEEINSESKLSYVSDLLQFAIEMAGKHHLHLKNQLKINSLKDLIEPDIVGRFGKEALPGTLHSVATVLRDFEARKGTASTLRAADQSAKLRPVRIFAAGDHDPTR